MENYEKILDTMLNLMGGKEYCVKQVVTENIHKKIINDFRNNNKQHIFSLFKNFYTDNFDEKNIINVDINNSHWNNYFLKIVYYDTENFRFFIYNIKKNILEETSLFINDDDEKNYSKTFFSKIKGGNNLWDKYEKHIENKLSENEKSQNELNFFYDNIKNFQFINIDDINENFNPHESLEQYQDGNIRYLHNNIYYYKIVGINGFITFHNDNDLLLNSGFARNFYEKIVKQIRE